MTWKRSRIPRPVDRSGARTNADPAADPLAPPEGACPHCGAAGAILDFQLVRCPNVDGCRYGDARVAEAIAKAREAAIRRAAEPPTRGSRWW